MVGRQQFTEDMSDTIMEAMPGHNTPIISPRGRPSGGCGRCECPPPINFHRYPKVGILGWSKRFSEE